MPQEFKGWDYKRYPSEEEREKRCLELVRDLRSGEADHVALCSDTRSVHLRMFSGMTDPGQQYFAGNYRGEDYEFLKNYSVVFDGRSGVLPEQVKPWMDHLSKLIQALPNHQASITSGMADDDRLFHTVGMVCSVMVNFFSIHPYADGNGHIGRYIVWALLAKFGHPPKRWEINKNYGDRLTYRNTINLFRSGDRLPLIKFVISSI